MDSTTVVNIVENGDSMEKELENDDITIKVDLVPITESGNEAESPAIESEKNDSLDKIENTKKQVNQKSSDTETLADTIEKEIITQSDSNETFDDSDAKTTDPIIEESLITDIPQLKVDSVLIIEGSQDKSKIPVDVEEQAANEDTESEDAEESFSEDEDPNEATTMSSELNQSPNIEENKNLGKSDIEGKGEGLSIDHTKLENGSVHSKVFIKNPIEIVNVSNLDEDKKLENQIPVQSEFSDTQTNESVSVRFLDKKDLNNQIKEIISDIDINIKAQEKITQLKEQELKLILKQNELSNQIHQQKLLAQQLNDQNQFTQRQNQWEAHEKKQRQSQPITLQPQELANISKANVDLRKIFTPATDTPEILPKNRKLYASSAFYSPTLHPTVEDQVELARRISHSLSDISNQASKGQSMYVNRKKRSVKWVHEGSGQANSDTNSASLFEVSTKLEKMPLKLVMNPKGQVRDYNSLKELINVETGLLSPDNCAELITALKLHQGRGAELFAKRRKKADNWIIDETNAGTQYLPSGIPDYQQYQPRPKTISPNILPAYSDAGKHRVQLNLHQNQLIEKYSKGGVQVVKSPWEAALQTGSASSAFLEESHGQCPTSSPTIYLRQSVPRDLADAVVEPSYDLGLTNIKQLPREEPFRSTTAPIPSNPQRVLAYTPNVAQGWGGRNVELPKEYFESNEVNRSPSPRCDCCIEYNTKKSDRLSSNFTKYVENRLNRLEDFQKCFWKQQQPLLPCSLSKKNIEMDDKINVRELIQSFEQQFIMETSKSNPNEEDGSEKIEGLYVPKEISLSSYVPPQQKQPLLAPQNYESTSRAMPKLNYATSADSQSLNGKFPVCTPLLPNQQHSSQLNYQKEPINNITPLVNFNPSPLSFDKLSRYENHPDNQNQQQYLSIRQKTQNPSPIPFGTSRSPISNPMGISPQPHNLSSVSYYRPSNQGQSFNKFARGWGEIQNKQHQQTYSSQYIPPPTLFKNLPHTEVPYSDF